MNIKVKKKILYVIGGTIFLYLTVVIIFYFNQERFGFKPVKLPTDHIFHCNLPIDEIKIPSYDGVNLHGLLVKADSAKGLILYFHGSGGNINRYTEDATIYAGLGYDVFLVDYRGYGKSEGEMINEKQFTDDLDIVYALMKESYEEKNIVLMGFSLGTFAASYLASKNKPKLLVLESPPYWIMEQYIKKFFFLPVKSLSKYSFETYKYVKETDVPIALFLGEKDHLSKETRWPQVLKPDDIFIILENAGHQNFAGKERFMSELRKLL